MSFLAITILLFAGVTAGCGNEGDDSTQSVKLRSDIIKASQTGQFLFIDTPESWTVTITHIPVEPVWCVAKTTSGKGKATVALNSTQNTVAQNRTVAITVKTASKQYELTLTQLAYQVEGGEGDGGDVVTSSWAELPKMIASDRYKYITHMTTIKSKQVRSYSMMYDPQEGLSYWVAYPLCPLYRGGSGRTEKWTYDPKVSSSLQPNYSGGVSGYDRGHQIPSADRTSDKPSNYQTFYYTNMTLQLSRLNQDKWAKLEGQVRTWAEASNCDTLYVVTGAILKTVGKDENVKHVNVRGKNVAVPNYYYKALLRLKKSGQYDAIGFWYEHRSYGNSAANAAETKSIDEIEAITGFDFFSALPQQVQSTVESTWRPSDWGL